ncbi:hypothetical protein A3G53_01150 [Candidatus Nomurabacteria bacterium RIFCSPLOWO2_12_FULL_44_11]|uniref:ParB-like N-terminal domain-containing protein n=1 Tax=Candidatus Nomurabacteria bacterium RIFCSPLOWO2_12_FULL_44_11 TaxID=1801796 RepID=A0A1F6Y813_9BACT|nr:MAG: hypothetical protein A3E95_01795 [Candidatus Nomurabacteria bacterium RIFCSPHIGHO2_12_FULL_44_22b]OGJ02485.1 MAG: hypothetical protein A3G53_01150 [Candidatus Nomurabacteria bacterium RIFCSPLOWO2_12_FULL_44_11]
MATADKAQVTSGSQVGQILRIPRSRIRRFETQPRGFFDAKAMNELADSIAEIGQQTPIIIKSITGDPDHDYELVDGERRWIACGMALVETMLAEVRVINDEDDQFEISVVSNFNRAEHTSLEIALAIDRMRKSKKLQGLSAGEQMKKIRKRFGRSEPWVYQHLVLLRLHPDVQAMMAPTLPEEERLSHMLGVFISSLHHDLQLDIAKTVMVKRMGMNQARLYARQVAEEAGVKIKTTERPMGMPSQSWRRLQNTVKVLHEGLDVLFVPASREALVKRNTMDLVLMVAEVEQCITRLTQLKAVLTPTLEVAPAEPKPVPAPTRATVVDVRPSHKVKEPAKLKPVVVALPPPPSAPKSAPAPTPELSSKQVLVLSHKILAALFYPNGQAVVNLGRCRLQEIVPEVDDLDMAVSKALRAGKDNWRLPPMSSEAEQKLRRLMHRFRHSYGNCAKFEESLEYARRRDESDDPVSTHVMR